MLSGLSVIWTQIKITVNNFISQPLRTAAHIQKNSKEIFGTGKAAVVNAASTISGLAWAVTGLFGFTVVPIAFVALAVAIATITNISKIVMTSKPLDEIDDCERFEEGLDEAALFMWLLTIQAFAAATVATAPLAVIGLTAVQFGITCLVTTGMWNLIMENFRNGKLLRCTEMVVSTSISVAAITFLLVPASGATIVAVLGILGIPLLTVIIGDAIVKVTKTENNGFASVA